MGEFSVYHWLVVLLLVVLLFGARRIPQLMRGLGEGIRALREGLSGNDAVKRSNGDKRNNS